MNGFMQRTLVTVAAAVLLLACSGNDEALFRAAEPQDLQQADEAAPAEGVVRQRLARVDTDYFNERIVERGGANAEPTMVRFNLFDDFAVDLALVHRPSEDATAPVILGGEAPDYEHSLVTLMLVEGRLSGNIRLDTRLFRIRPAGDGLYLIEEVEPPVRREHDD